MFLAEGFFSPWDWWRKPTKVITESGVHYGDAFGMTCSTCLGASVGVGWFAMQIQKIISRAQALRLKHKGFFMKKKLFAALATMLLATAAFAAKLKIPPYLVVDGTTVVGVKNQKKLPTELVIPEGVTAIGGRAFYSCTSLSSVTIPSSVTAIGETAFSGCTSIAGVAIPSSVTSIGNYAFYYCTSLASVSIPGSVKEIGESAFNGCASLKNVTIGDGVKGNRRICVQWLHVACERCYSEQRGVNWHRCVF